MINRIDILLYLYFYINSTTFISNSDLIKLKNNVGIIIKVIIDISNLSEKLNKSEFKISEEGIYLIAPPLNYPEYREIVNSSKVSYRDLHYSIDPTTTIYKKDYCLFEIVEILMGDNPLSRDFNINDFSIDRDIDGENIIINYSFQERLFIYHSLDLIVVDYQKISRIGWSSIKKISVNKDNAINKILYRLSTEINT